ncbi:LOW QUALITY PROTEIN: TEuncharacterized [Mya arenaria]|uniref:TEuncharacterized n=1 Tax=Mya arenaria TaxID=6604 RepID=A0ABY7FMJ2_MYAAR|nr:LOW QUALITY PROTEIN: TEuncharacterized [Mya arenaria]
MINLCQFGSNESANNTKTENSSYRNLKDILKNVTWSVLKEHTQLLSVNSTTPPLTFPDDCQPSREAPPQAFTLSTQRGQKLSDLTFDETGTIKWVGPSSNDVCRIQTSTRAGMNIKQALVIWMATSGSVTTKLSPYVAISPVFWIENESENYRLQVDGYSGNAGDSLTYHDNFEFTTKDRDNDKSGSNCAQLYLERGGITPAIYQI